MLTPFTCSCGGHCLGPALVMVDGSELLCWSHWLELIPMVVLGWGLLPQRFLPWAYSLGGCSLISAPVEVTWKSLFQQSLLSWACSHRVADTGLVTCRLLALACSGGDCSVFGPSLEEVNGSGLFLWKSLAQISPEEVCGLGQIPGSSLAWTCSLDS